MENWIKSGRRGTQIAAELGVSYPSLKDWKRRYVGDATPSRANLAAKNRALKAKLVRVRKQRDIFKKTLGMVTLIGQECGWPVPPSTHFSWRHFSFANTGSAHW